MDYLPINQIWPLIALVRRLFRALERAGIDKIYIITIFLVVAIVVDSLLITLLVSLRYVLFLGLLGIPLNAALRWTAGTSTSLEENIVQSLDRVYEIPGMLADDSDDRLDSGSDQELRIRILAEGQAQGGE